MEEVAYFQLVVFNLLSPERSAFGARHKMRRNAFEIREIFAILKKVYLI